MYVSRRTGLGRGLSAILPEVTPEAIVPQRAHVVAPLAPVMDTLATELLSDLAARGSGLSTVYRALDGLVENYHLDDAVLIVDEPGLGRQIFAAGRRALEADEATELLQASPGLYTDPEADISEADLNALLSVCMIALRLDILRFDAWHDGLTGLYDRRSFERLLEMAVERSKRYGWRFSLVLIDLDDFKLVNDNGGHAAGDEALQVLADRFRRVLRNGDNVARIGGDEFALILPDTGVEDVPALLERVAKPSAELPDSPPFSYGVAQCPIEADTVDGLFRLADDRLYQAKGRR